MDWLLRQLGLLAVRIFYRTIGTEGAERIPDRGPVIVVANHPNGLLDPVVTQLALRRRLAFLAKSTLFGNPFGRWLMRAFDAVPVYRARDKEDTSQNERTFQLCRERLGRGEWLMLFPEGTSHSDPALRPLKTGAARIALSAEAAAGFELGLQILPVGLLYDDKEIFRSQAVAVVGARLQLRGYAARYAEDERATVEALTEAIDEALSAVVLEAESDELWRGFLAVAAWTDAEAQRDVAARDVRARRLARAYHELSLQRPEAAAEIVEAARRFARALEEIGVGNPFSIDPPTAPTPRTIARSLVSIVLLAPIAALGMILGWAPYELIAVLMAQLKKRHLEIDLTSTMKALSGVVFFPATYLLEGLAVAHFAGWAAGASVLVLGPASGFIALRWLERIELRREAVRSWWITARQAGLVEAIARRRVELCERVERALG